MKGGIASLPRTRAASRVAHADRLDQRVYRSAASDGCRGTGCAIAVVRTACSVTSHSAATAVPCEAYVAISTHSFVASHSVQITGSGTDSPRAIRHHPARARLRPLSRARANDSLSGNTSMNA